MKIQGVMVPVVTPFAQDGHIDYPALAALLAHQLEAGVSGIVACGTTGEYYALSQTERRELMAFIAKEVGDKALLIAGVNDTHSAGSIVKALEAKELGYQALMLAPPIYCLPEQDEIIAHYQTVSREADMPIIMYNFPARSGVEIGIEVIKVLARDPNIVGIKESSGDFTRAVTLLNLGLEDFEVVCGSDDQAADYLFWGARSWIGGGANYLAGDHVNMIEAAKADDWQQVRSIMARILPVLQNMESGGYNQKAKLGCGHIGYPVGPVRAPLYPVSKQDEEDFLALLTQALK
ncbi:dihydrodipicolinate synthase family protein [Oceanisphaera arctica]|uniref:Dihydrodipicolinate synthase family protein n=1 Tax=Oceanisphaera arctica TaxID=641510 RepID=A0A2P5TLZ3_9GAMM|nr:dihydrodipicolinate synthase family protein [Oceanisphaera arctica]PPL16360.1 dihydrodipicolinate synthase family protein [Oceanisphaera arctica]GHA14229.1 dihydrodipicolinate synthase family protein [Oceanisphaera arctica]